MRDGGPAFRAAMVLAIVVVGVLVVVWVLGDQAYLWVKAIHVVAVVSWMAGLLYLPRLFVYHTDAAVGSELSQTLKVMERRLLAIIATPAMIVTWALGLWLAWRGGLFLQVWFMAKLVLVIGLSALHMYFAWAVREFHEDKRTKTARHWRIMNEMPALIMVLAVILVIVKPI